MIFVRNIAFYFSFYFFSIIYVLLAVPVMLISRDALLRLVRSWSRFHRWCVTALLGITIDLQGEAPKGAMLYAIRHESFFEAIDMPCLLDFPTVFAKKELFLIPGWGWAAKVYGLVPVARDKGARTLREMLAAAKARSAEGRELVIFPEGTRVAHGRTVPLQSGFAGLYKLLRLPVVPVAVDSGPLYHRLLKRPGTITYRFGQVIEPGLGRAEIEDQVSMAINALNGPVDGGAKGASEKPQHPQHNGAAGKNLVDQD